MKLCPNCGAGIKNSAASFCPKCKKSLSKPVRTTGSDSRQLNQNAHSGRKPPQNHQIQKKPIPKKKPWLLAVLMPEKNKPSAPGRTPIKNPMDENYDGYYKDRPTEDNAQNKESLDPELIKRIAFIAGGAVVFIVLAVILMNLL